MLKLINIKKGDNLIEADYIPESSNLKAHISLNIESQEYNAEEIEEYGAVYSRMAANGLIRTLDELNNGKIKTPPKERLVMWY